MKFALTSALTLLSMLVSMTCTPPSPNTPPKLEESRPDYPQPPWASLEFFNLFCFVFVFVFKLRLKKELI